MAFDWNAYLADFRSRAPKDLQQWVGKGVSTSSLLGSSPIDTSKDPFSWLGQPNTGFDIRDNSVFTYTDYNDPKFKQALDAWTIDQTLKSRGLSTPGSYYWNRMQAGPAPGMSPLIGAGLALAGSVMGIPPVWAGAIGGAVNAAGNDQNILEGAAKGGAIGWAGGQIAQGVGDIVGFNPTIADATWSSTATPISQLGVQAGTNTLTGALQSGTRAALTGGDVGTAAITGGVTGGVNASIPSSGNPMLDQLLRGSVGSTISQAISNPNQSIQPSVSGNTPVGNTNNLSGGSMATTDQTGGMNLQDLYNLIMTGGTALNTASQRRSLDANNQQAINQIMAPTPDQAQYRQQLSTLMQDPGSITSSPVYQFASEQGQSALERVLNARGMRGSGNELYEMQKFGQGLAGQQFYNQANLLAGLSGIPQDTSRSLAAGQQIRQGGITNAAMQGQILGDIGLGAQQILGQGQGGGGLGTTTIASLLKQAGDWFSPTESTIQDWSSPVFESNYSWDNLDSFFNSTPSIDTYNQFTPDTSNYVNSFAGDQSTFLQSLMNPSYSFGW